MQPVNRTFLFAITGGIASGKSLFAQMLNSLGLQTIDSDKIAHDVLQIQSIRKLLLVRWGERILKDDKIDRRVVASIVFNDPNELKILNQLVHPVIIREMQRLIDECTKAHLGFEVPLLFEAGFHRYFDLNVIVTASDNTRMQRLLSRGMNREEASKRIASQMTETEKAELADIVVNNEGDIKSLEKEAIRVYNHIRQCQQRDILLFKDYFQHH